MWEVKEEAISSHSRKLKHNCLQALETKVGAKASLFIPSKLTSFQALLCQLPVDFQIQAHCILRRGFFVLLTSIDQGNGKGVPSSIPPHGLPLIFIPAGAGGPPL